MRIRKVFTNGWLLYGRNDKGSMRRWNSGGKERSVSSNAGHNKECCICKDESGMNYTKRWGKSIRDNVRLALPVLYKIRPMAEKKILDVCCGGRMFRFDKSHPLCHFMDMRSLPKWSISSRPDFHIDPDEIWDFRDIKADDKSYKIVVMDPPHLQKLWDNSWMAKKYGRLPKTWKEDLQKWFTECMRVLDDYGILIFKRNEHEIPLAKLMKLFPQKPMIWHRTGKNNKTIWLIYLKPPT